MSDVVIMFGALARKAAQAAKRAPSAAVSKNPAAARVAEFDNLGVSGLHLVGQLHELFDRSGMLYGELARFVLRLLGIRTKPRKVHPPGPDGLPLPGPETSCHSGLYIEEPKAAPNGSWDNVWENNASK